MTRHFIKEALRPKWRRGFPDAGPPIRDPAPCWQHIAHKPPETLSEVWDAGSPPRFSGAWQTRTVRSTCPWAPTALLAVPPAPLGPWSGWAVGTGSLAQEEGPSRAPRLYQAALKGHPGSAWGWRRLSTLPQTGQLTADSRRRLTNRAGTAWLYRTATSTTGQGPYTSAGLKGMSSVCSIAFEIIANQQQNTIYVQTLTLFPFQEHNFWITSYENMTIILLKSYDATGVSSHINRY